MTLDQANTTVSDDTGAVAWLHPTAGWVHHDRQQVAMHCRKDGPGPVPLYARRATADVTEAANAIIDRTIERCKAMHEYAGRDAWVDILREELTALAALNPPMGR